MVIRMSIVTDLRPMLNADDLKFLISIIDYSLFACPVDGGIEKGDGSFATRENFENVQKRLKEVLFAIEHSYPA